MRRCWSCLRPLARVDRMVQNELCTACLDRRVDELLDPTPDPESLDAAQDDSDRMLGWYREEVLAS